MLKRSFLLLLICCAGCTYNQRIAMYWKKNPQVVQNNSDYMASIYSDYSPYDDVAWAYCLTGQEKIWNRYCGEMLDKERDHDIDLRDFALYQNQFLLKTAK